MKLLPTALAVSLALAATLSQAVTLRVANQGDVQSMDPHSLNETLQLSFTASVYEPLVGRDRNMALVPLLATKWTQTSPTVWRFDLRRNVKFHDGTPFTADDVVFTFKRAAGDGSDMKGYTQAFKTVRKIDDHTVEIETGAPYPILPDVISNVYVMSKKWCEENKAEIPVDRRKGIENTASFKSNGTGPFRLRERQPSVRTTLVRNFSYWDKVDTNIDDIVFTPIGNDATGLRRCCRERSTSWSRCPCRTSSGSSPPAISPSSRARSCARSSSAWTRSGTSCSSPTSKARTRSRTSASVRRSSRPSTSRRSRRAPCAARRRRRP
jgi:peptide/nickel transport system substrate-binding protein